MLNDYKYWNKAINGQKVNRKRLGIKFNQYICRDCPSNDRHTYHLEKKEFEYTANECPYCEKVMKYNGSTKKSIW